MKVKILSVGQPFGSTGEVVSPAMCDEIMRTFPKHGVPVNAVNARLSDAPAVGWATSISRDGDDLVAHVELSADTAALVAAADINRLPAYFSCSVILDHDPESGSPRKRLLDVSVGPAFTTRTR